MAVEPHKKNERENSIQPAFKSYAISTSLTFITIARTMFRSKAMVQTKIQMAELTNTQSTHGKNCIRTESKIVFLIVKPFRVHMKFNRILKHQTATYSWNNFKKEIWSISHYTRFLGLRHIERKPVVFIHHTAICFIRFLAWSKIHSLYSFDGWMDV